jgi:hypothetical protein
MPGAKRPAARRTPRTTGEAMVLRDVVRAGNDQDGRCTPTRRTTIARNTGHSIDGPPTGRRVHPLGTTDHVVRDGRFVEEWSERGVVNLLKQPTPLLQSRDLAK